MKTIAHKTALAFAALLLTAGAAQAASITFSGVIDDGLLAGQTFSGLFSYDDPLPGVVLDTAPLTSLLFSFAGTSYNLSQADVGSTFANFAVGEVLGFDANYSGDTTLTFSTGFGSPFVDYRVASTGDRGSGSYSVSAVPEPSTWLLSLGGLAVLGAMGARRRSEVRVFRGAAATGG